MTLAIDASVTLAWYFDDEATPETDALLEQVAASGAIVPALWRLEVANALQVSIRRKRIDTAYRDHVLRRLARMAITVDPDGEAHAWTTVLHLADRQNLTMYDAAYLELAQRRDLPLGTLDRDLQAAARAIGVPVLGG